MSKSHEQLKPPVGSHDHAQGPEDAPLTLVEYGDYECPHCGRAHGVLKGVQRRLGDRLRFVFRNFPLDELHPHAVAAASVAEAAALQGKFWPMHDLIFEHQNALEGADLSRYATRLHLDGAQLKGAAEGEAIAERIRADFASGVNSGVNGTPTFFVNGRHFAGDWTNEDAFVAALEALA